MSSNKPAIEDTGTIQCEPWTTDVLYVEGLEKYVLRRNERFDVEHPVGPDAVYKYLVSGKGFEPMAARLILRRVRHDVVETVDCDPNQPAVFVNEDSQRVANRYVPPRLVPAAGQWPTIRALIDVLVQPSINGPKALDWQLNWFAAKYQEPGTRSFTSVTIIGPQGLGKSAMGEFFGCLLGEENVASVSGHDFKESFNSQFVTRLLVVVNELVVPGERSEIVETLKTYHTEARVTLRTPHAKRVLVKNRMSLWITSNSPAAVKLEAHRDRRYTVFVVPPEALTPEHEAILKGMFDEKTKKPTPAIMAELAAFAHDLAQYKVDWTLAAVPFVNEARHDLARASRTALETFLDDVEESAGTAVGEWVKRYIGSLSEAQRDTLPVYEFKQGLTVDVTYKAFLYYAREAGFRSGKPPTKEQFGVAWKGRFSQRWGKIRRSAMPRAYVLLGLHSASYERTALKSVAG